MRWFQRCVVLLGVAALVLTVTAAGASAQDTQDYPPSATVVGVSASTVGAGECVTATQSGLAPGTVVTFVLEDSGGGTTTVTATADATGVATAELCVPSDATSGAAAITTSVGAEVFGISVVNVGAQADPSGDLAVTGRSTSGTLKAAALAVLIGAVLVGLSRRREVLV